MMETVIINNAEPTELVIRLLSQHLPYSLPTLRRLQSMTSMRAQTSNQHVLSTFEKESPKDGFLVAYLDFSRGPETEMWLYSSIENPTVSSNEVVCEEQVLKLLECVREIERKYIATYERETPGILLIGSLHKRILQLLERHSLVKKKTLQHFKFIFKIKDLPVRRELPEELTWSSVRASDIPLVLSRTAIPYKESVSWLSDSQ
jgi:hypothetical protein